MGKAIMFQGTSSHVGKSWLAAALCRILVQDGYRVMPYKSQNMALNSFVTPDGGEIGRSQALQAQAAKVVPSVDMNPILLKPKADAVSQVVVLGKPLGDMGAWDYRANYLDKAVKVVEESLERLKENSDVVVIEGAGSPAEINLKDREIVNMRVAKLAQAPVILIGDIDRGGVFASIVGTLELLEPEERALVKGFVINKFRGDIKILEPGLDFLEERTGIPVLGVIPHSDVRLEQEDSVSLERDVGRGPTGSRYDCVEVAVIQLPHISNFTDFDPLDIEPTVVLRYVKDPAQLGQPDAVMIPGTKNTLGDLRWLKEKGFGEQIMGLWQKGATVVGICGGYQMMGEALIDEEGFEDLPGRYEGLGLLPVDTVYNPDKRTVLVEGELAPKLALSWGLEAGDDGFLNSDTTISETQSVTVKGYEIHMGSTDLDPSAATLFEVRRQGDKVGKTTLDGVYVADGRAFGTYLHGLFENGGFTRLWLNSLRRRKGLPALSREEGPQDYWEAREVELDQWASTVRNSLDIEKLMSIISEGV